MTPRRPALRTTHGIERPTPFVALPDEVKRDLVNRLGKFGAAAPALFDGLAALATTYLQEAVEDEASLDKILVERGVSPRLGNVLVQVQRLEKAVSHLSAADWRSLNFADQFASRTSRNDWRDKYLCLELDMIDFFDAFYMRTLELSQVLEGVRKGKGRPQIRGAIFDKLGDDIVKLWINTTNSVPTYTKNSGGITGFVDASTNHLSGSATLLRFSGPKRKSNDKANSHYLVERAMRERRPTIRQATKAGLKRWKANNDEIK